MTNKEKAEAIRGKYMTMSYSIEPDGNRFPLNYKLYIERLEALLYDAETTTGMIVEANELIRSFLSIVIRKGRDTNWDAIRDRTNDILNKQHQFLNNL